MLTMISSLAILSIFSSVSCVETGRAQQEPVNLLEYKSSSGGLKDQMEDVLAAIKKRDTATVSHHVKQMVLPEGSDWFIRVFGEQGRSMADRYESGRIRYAASLETGFTSALESKMTDVQVDRFDEACASDASELQYPILAARQVREPLYVVRLMRGNTYQSHGFFAFVDGAFRYVGMPPVGNFTRPKEAASTESSPQRVRVGGTVQQAALIYQEGPIYPERAKQRGLQGTVRISALIGKDGTMKDLQVIRGHCWLAEAAVNAVKKWRYRPTSISKHPVEVVSTVDVVFTLNMRP